MTRSQKGGEVVVVVVVVRMTTTTWIYCDKELDVIVIKAISFVKREGSMHTVES